MNTTHIERASQKTVLVTDYDYCSKLRKTNSADILALVRKCYWQEFYGRDIE